MSFGLNPFKEQWLDIVGSDTAVSPEASLVASTLGRSLGVGRVALTNWQWINVSLGRERSDPAVFVSLRELVSADYLERYLGDGLRAHTHGWRLTLPGKGH